MLYINHQLEPIREFITEFSDFKNKISDKLDWLMSSYQKFEDELTVKSEQEARVEKRLTALEKRPISS